MQVDYGELQDNFEAAPAKTPPRLGGAAAARPATPAAAESVLNMDRTRTVGVLMRTLKLDAAGLDAALAAALAGGEGGGARRLEDNEVEGLLAALPSAVEAQKLLAVRCGPMARLWCS